MADLPIELDPAVGARLAAALDREGKIPRALEALGPIADRDVVLVDGSGGLREAQLRELGGRVTTVESAGERPFDAPVSAADVLVAFWSAFAAGDPKQLAAAARLLRPGGRLLVLHDYGRDDVSRLRGDRPEYGAWSKRNGPFLGAGFRVRVIHCFWTFDSVAEAAELLGDVFGAAGRAFAAGLTRPRLSYNVAVYHRTIGEQP